MQTIFRFAATRPLHNPEFGVPLVPAEDFGLMEPLCECGEYHEPFVAVPFSWDAVDPASLGPAAHAAWRKAWNEGFSASYTHDLPRVAPDVLDSMEASAWRRGFDCGRDARAIIDEEAAEAEGMPEWADAAILAEAGVRTSDAVLREMASMWA